MLVNILIPQIFAKPFYKGRRIYYISYELRLTHTHINKHVLFSLEPDIITCLYPVYDIYTLNIYENCHGIVFKKIILTKHVEYLKNI